MTFKGFTERIAFGSPPRNASLWMSAGANVLIVLAGIIVFHPSAMSVLWAFWCDCVIAGVLTVIRLCTLKDFSVFSFIPDGNPSVNDKRRQALSILAFSVLFYFILFSVFQGISKADISSFVFIAVSAGLLFIGRLISYLRDEVIRRRENGAPPDITLHVFSPLVQFMLIIAAIFPGILFWVFLNIFLLFAFMIFRGPFDMISSIASDVTVLLFAAAVKMGAEYGIPALIRWYKSQPIKVAANDVKK